KLLRESFRDDGAEGESVHIVCHAAERALSGPPAELFPSAWAHIEINGHREHYGRIEQQTFLGAPLLVVHELRCDGSFKEHRYAAGALLGAPRMTEEEVRKHMRRMLQSSRYGQCEAFIEGKLMGGHCAPCGYGEERHGQHPKLPPHHAADHQ